MHVNLQLYDTVALINPHKYLNEDLKSLVIDFERTIKATSNEGKIYVVSQVIISSICDSPTKP